MGLMEGKGEERRGGEERRRPGTSRWSCGRRESKMKMEAAQVWARRSPGGSESEEKPTSNSCLYVTYYKAIQRPKTLRTHPCSEKRI